MVACSVRVARIIKTSYGRSPLNSNDLNCILTENKTKRHTIHYFLTQLARAVMGNIGQRLAGTLPQPSALVLG